MKYSKKLKLSVSVNVSKYKILSHLDNLPYILHGQFDENKNLGYILWGTPLKNVQNKNLSGTTK